MNALDVIINGLKSTISSMTKVLKPLKFLQPIFENLVILDSGLEEIVFRGQLVDVLSILAITIRK